MPATLFPYRGSSLHHIVVGYISVLHSAFLLVFSTDNPKCECTQSAVPLLFSGLSPAPPYFFFYCNPVFVELILRSSLALSSRSMRLLRMMEFDPRVQGSPLLLFLPTMIAFLLCRLQCKLYLSSDPAIVFSLYLSGLSCVKPARVCFLILSEGDGFF